jgi:hypothetical protein
MIRSKNDRTPRTAFEPPESHASYPSNFQLSRLLLGSSQRFPMRFTHSAITRVDGETCLKAALTANPQVDPVEVASEF